MNLTEKFKPMGMMKFIHRQCLKLMCFSVFIVFLLACGPKNNPEKKSNAKEYEELKERLEKGWNTWDNNDVLSQVLLPSGFSINLELHDKTTGETLENALIGRRGVDDEKVKPGLHSYGGSYSDLEVEWKGCKIKVRTVSDSKDIGIIIEPVSTLKNMELFIRPEILWGRPGNVEFNESGAVFNNGSGNISFSVNQISEVKDSVICCLLSEKIWISTWKDKSVADLELMMQKERARILESEALYGKDSLLCQAMHAVLAWNTIYEPNAKGVIVPVSRLWSSGWNGWVLFEWDTYFSAAMLALDNKDLAYANALALTKEITKSGFVPNYASQKGATEDRSQPPVGTLVIKEIYKKYNEKWFLEETYDELLSWNRWWERKRDVNGYLCWGSDLYEETPENVELLSVSGTKEAAMWESGLDNSPMYEEASFDSINRRLMLADVGLMSLYISDCQNLAEIAALLGKPADEKELLKRAEKYKTSLETLWDDKFGMYLNKDLVTGELKYTLSPTSFYPLLAKVPDQERARRMMDAHFFNPEEFWGEWILPSVAKNNHFFESQNYWRGRIWGPMNFLVYLGLRNYDLPDAQKVLVDKSANLILQSWTGENHVYENYNSVSGVGDDPMGCDRFYHWGALLGYISLIEYGYVPCPEEKLK